MDVERLIARQNFAPECIQIWARPSDDEDRADLELLRESNPALTLFLSDGRIWLPDGYSQIFRSYVFGPSGFWTMALLRYTAKFDPFLSLDCAPTPSTLAQSKERKGSNFEAQRSGAIVQKPEGPKTKSSKSSPCITVAIFFTYPVSLL